MAKASAFWGSLLAGCILFLIIAFALGAAVAYGLPEPASILAVALAGFAILAYLQKESGAGAVFASGALAMLFLFSTAYDPYAPTVALSLAMLAAPMWWLSRQGKGWRGALAELGLVRRDWAKEALFGIPLTLGIFVMMFFLVQAYVALGISDSEKVAGIVKELPLQILLLAVIVSPLTEEIFFRGFLVPRIGVLPSAALFGISHISYGSVAEVVSVFFIGAVFGIVFQRRRTLVPVIVSHIIINGLAIIVMKFALQVAA